MIRLQNYVIGALVKYYAVERTALGAAFIEEPADMQYAAQVAAWYASLAPEQRLPIEALRVLAAPDLLADIRVLRGRDSLTRTCYLAKLRATGPEGLLVAPQQDGSLDIQRVASDDAVTDTMLAWLAAAGEPGEPLWRVSLTPTARPATQQARSRTCPGCGQSLPPHARFCGFCGTKLG